jgi:hypothetical protein
MTFTHGQRLKWTSSSNGSTKTKVGKVVEAVQPGKLPSSQHGDYGLRSDGLPRDHVSYVMHVNGATQRARGQRFWPIASKLKDAP